MLEDDNFVGWIELILVERVRDGHLNHLSFLQDALVSNRDDSVLLRRQHLSLLLRQRVFNQVIQRLVTVEVELVFFLIDQHLDLLLCVVDLVLRFE